ncbi:MAG TPA: DUF4279 domain-containing protein, partial [Gallionella sp.]|nr:DUF4279 domain-containing protein [Gallionella sp.]
MIKHPTTDLAVITEKTGLSPLRHWRHGEPRVTPKGTPLPSTHESSAWICRFEYEGNKAFFPSVNSLIVELERNREFLIGLVDDGGEVYLNVNLDGRANIGD